MVEFIYQQVILQFRIPIGEDGKLGHPEIVKKFTSDIKGAQEYKMKNPQYKQKEQELQEKEKETQMALDKLKTEIAPAEEM
jgi:hypothetical protein